jgi:polyvinyl alcohol dehydrogenase (cytochrome)
MHAMIERVHTCRGRKRRMNVLRFPSVLALFALLGGCDVGTHDSIAGEIEKETSAAKAMAPSANSIGKMLYTTHCAHCHDGSLPKAPHRDMIALLAPSAIVRALDTGVMREQASALDQSQRHAVAQFLTGSAVEPLTNPFAPLACKPDTSGFDFNAPPMVEGWGVTLGNSHFYTPAMTRIDRDNVAKLRLKWVFPFPEATRARSQPVLAGGALYVGSHDGSVIALDRDTGCVRWSYQASAEVRTGIAIDRWNAGDASVRPRLYFGDLIGNVYALDAIDGELLWRDKPDDHHSVTITAAPVRFEDTLYVGLSALEVTAAADASYACCTFRGGVVAYDVTTGERRWLTRTIDEEAKPVGKSDVGTPRLAPSGAPIWAGLTIDAARRRLYAGTGENFSSPANDRSDAIIAFDLDSGKIAWSWQATKGDAWNMGCETADRANCPPENGPDYDFAAAPVLVKIAAGKDVLLAGQKSAVVHALDPDNGTLIWQRKLGRGGIQGGVHFGMSSEGTLIFVPISDFYGGPRWPGEAKPGLYALDIATGEVRWEFSAPNPCNGKTWCDPGISAAIAGVRGVVFAGSMDGYIRAHDSANGALLWQFDTAREFDALGGMKVRGGSIGGGSAPVFAGSEMFLNSGYGIYGHMPGAALMAFTVAD